MPDGKLVVLSPSRSGRAPMPPEAKNTLTNGSPPLAAAHGRQPDVAIVAGLTWGTVPSFRIGSEIALAPELNSPM
jgi:hypothetical protein